jgi:hypothetical protein
MTLEFSEQQVAYLLQTLAQRPLGEALELFNSIQRQAQQQMPSRGGNGAQAAHHLQPVSG